MENVVYAELCAETTRTNHIMSFYGAPINHIASFSLDVMIRYYRINPMFAVLVE